jgi:myo-inositol-1(or 4)-monophosphatase
VNELLRYGINAAKMAGVFISSTRPTTIEIKSHCNDFVTDVDKMSQELIRDFLKETKINLLGEESFEEYTPSEDFLWVVDPIDGTANYVKGNPLVGVNIALVKADKVLLGVTYLPYLDQMYHAVLDGGSFLNEVRYQRDDNPYGVIIADPTEEVCLKDVDRKMGSFRRLGASSVEMAWCSRGIYSAVMYKKNKIWDIAPGILLISESGGVVKRRADSIATGMFEDGRIIAGSRERVGELQNYT